MRIAPAIVTVFLLAAGLAVGEQPRSGPSWDFSHGDLKVSDDLDELVLLAKCGDARRVPGAEAPDLTEALDYLRELVATCGE